MSAHITREFWQRIKHADAAFSFLDYKFSSKNSSPAYKNKILYFEGLFQTHWGTVSPNSVHHFAGTCVALAKTRLPLSSSSALHH